jgi:hypothetical protein
MTSLFQTRRLLLLAVMALILPLAVACSGGDDDEDPTATTEAASTVSTPEAETSSDADSTPTSASDSDSTPETDTTASTDSATTPDTETTPEADTTGTPDADSTPDTATIGTPEGDGTPEMASTPDADTTGTPDSGSTPGTGGVTDDPFEDVGELQADVPNFTLDFTGSFENVPDDTGQTFSADLEMMLMQSEPDIYHLDFTTTGDDAIAIEVWSLADATYIAEGDEAPVELPGGFASEFAPSNVLVVVPPVEALSTAEEVGPDEIDGRAATEYSVDPEAAAMILAAEGTEINDPQGEMNIWIDDEFGVVLQMTADVSWTNADDTEAHVVIDYMVSDVGETDDIEAPTS